ncbi:MAG: phage tail tape measure protein [Sterolibacterium sp.]|nr:phage tail tape measure protein [Sterolibacterium sp.]
MSAEKLKLEVLLAAVDRVTRPMQAMKASSVALSKALNAAKDQLRELSNQQKLIDSWRSTGKAIGINAQELDKARELVKRLKLEMDATAVPTVKMQRALAEATEKARNLAATANRLTEKKQRLRYELAAAGVDTKKLSDYQRDLKTKMDAATAAVNKQAAAAEEHGKKMQRLHAAQATRDKWMAGRDKLVGFGLKASVAGAAISLPAVKATKDYATFETAMLGVARQVNGARDDNGKLTATYYEMGDAIKAMGERIPMTTVELAKIVEAGARMGIQGKKDLLTYTQVTATMAQAFDLPVDRLGEDMAKVAQLFKQPIDRIGEMGDAINYLDDNALAKGGDIIEVLKRIGGTAQMVNMNFKEAAALGSTFLSLGAMPEVAATASNAMIRELSIATMQTKRFRGGLALLNLDAKALQLGMNKDATGTIIKVLEAIKALPQEKQLEAATRLFGKEYGDDAAKLAQNLTVYREQLGLVNAERAKGSMQREGDARKDTIDSRMLMAKNSLFNLSSDLGKHLKPALVETLEKTLAIIQAVREWAKENPALAAGLMTNVKWLAIGVSAVGALALAAAAVLGPLALLKFSITTLGLGAPQVGERLGKLLPTLTSIQSAAQTMGQRVADAWHAAAPGSGSFKAKLEKIAVASKQARANTKDWAIGLGGELKTRLSVARLAVADYTRQVWASILATRTAAATKFTAAISHVRTRGVTGITADAGMGMWNMLKGGAQATLSGIGAALRGIGQVLIFVGRAALMNPLGLVITGIAVAALLVIKYWGPIKAFFSGFWEGLKEGLAPLEGLFSGAFEVIGEALAPLKPVWDWLVGALKSAWDWVSKLFEPFQSTGEELDAATQKGKGFGLWLGELVVSVAELVGKFFNFGKDIVGGLIDGIVSNWKALKEIISKTANLMPEWMRRPLDMHSPSRVFAQIGGYTMEGLEQGILGGKDGPLTALMGISKQLTAAGAGVLIGGTALAGELPRIDTRPAIAPAGMAAAGNAGGNTYIFQIYAAPGMDENALAQVVERKIRSLDAQRAARGRSRLTDSE